MLLFNIRNSPIPILGLIESGGKIFVFWFDWRRGRELRIEWLYKQRVLEDSFFVHSGVAYIGEAYTSRNDNFRVCSDGLFQIGTHDQKCVVMASKF